MPRAKQKLTDEQIEVLLMLIDNHHHRRWLWLRLRIWGSWLGAGLTFEFARMVLAFVQSTGVGGGHP